MPDLLRRNSPHPPRPGLGRRHHLPAHRRREISVSGHRLRRVLPPLAGLVNGRSHAGRTRHRRAQRGHPHLRRTGGRRHSSQRSRGSVRVEGVRRRLLPRRNPPVHGAVGTSADNSAAESFLASLKREILPGRRGWPTARAARLAVFRWVGFYNHRRRHSTISYLAPVAFEQRSTTLASAA
ncbi:integrase core domain-containing protein [Streptomyces sp. M19]